MTDLPDFTKNSCPENSNVVDTHRSPHEILRRAIDALEPGEQIVLSVQVAMGLIMEFKQRAEAAEAQVGIVRKCLEEKLHELSELDHATKRANIRLTGELAEAAQQVKELDAYLAHKFWCGFFLSQPCTCGLAALSGRGESQ